MSNAATPKQQPWLTLLVCLALAAATFAVYLPTLHHGIVYYDDPQYVTDNAHVLSGLKWANLRWAATAVCACNWHPLTMLSHMADAQFFGTDYGKHHLTTLLFHTANTLLLFLLLRRLTSAFWRSTLVAALFALHPLHVESVAWLAERKDVLSGFFFMLTLLAYTSYAKRAKGREQREGSKEKNSRAPVSNSTHHASRSTRHTSLFYALTLLAFALGLMSKPMLVTLPFVLLLFDFWPLGRLRFEKTSVPKSLVPLLKEKLPFFALTIASSLVTFYAQRTGGAVNSLESIPLAWRAGNAIISYEIYLRQMFWPTHLVVLYPYPLNPSTEVAISLLVLAVITITVFRWAKREPWLPVGWLWYLGMLTPVIGLIQVGDQAHADRYTYLPSIGIFIIVTWSGAQLVAQIFNLLYRRFSTCERPEPQPRNLKPSAQAPVISSSGLPVAARAIILGAAGFLLASLGLAAHRQVGYWSSSYALFQHAAEVTKDNYVAREGLGIAQLHAGNYSAAMTNLFQARDSAGPYGATGRINYYIGAALQLQGKGIDALSYLEQAKVGPDLEAERKCRLGACLAEAGRLAEAEKAIREAIAAKPEKDEFQLAMAGLLQMQQHTTEAENLYRQTVTEHPDSALAHRAYGDFLMLSHRTADAEAQYAAAITNGTPDPALHRSYANALKVARPAEAIRQLQEGLKLEPANAQLQFDLAEILADQGRKREAITHYNTALDASPQFLFALNNLAWLLATDPDDQLRDGRRAVELAERACQASKWQSAFLIGTLAAAYAEAGRFPDAVATAERARDTARANNQESIAKRNEQLLALYRAGKPFHETK